MSKSWYRLAACAALLLLAGGAFLLPAAAIAEEAAADISKAKRVLGYRPEVTLSEGLERTAAWYRNNDLL